MRGAYNTYTQTSQPHYVLALQLPTDPHQLVDGPKAVHSRLECCYMPVEAVPARVDAQEALDRGEGRAAAVVEDLFLFVSLSYILFKYVVRTLHVYYARPRTYTHIYICTCVHKHALPFG